MELIKIGDAAVSEEKVVETTAMASNEEKEESVFTDVVSSESADNN